MESPSNLPPGCTLSQIPGNTPEDTLDQEAWDEFEKSMLEDQDTHNLTGEECLIIWRVGLAHVLSERKASNGTVREAPPEY